MEIEKLKTVASTITGILEEEGIMSLDELRDMANLPEKDVLMALDWLKGKERVELLPVANIMNIMLMF